MPVEAKLFPIAETFYSIQGEGVWTGTPMFFIRMAGCNVGRYPPPQPRREYDYEVQYQSPPRPFQILHPEHSTCMSFNGEEFICDTDYRVKERLNIGQLLALIPKRVEHVVLTGGEPLMHPDIKELIVNITRFNPMVHVETSGTKDLKATTRLMELAPPWVTCSPKHGYLPSNTPFIDEFKFLVRGPADEKSVLDFIHAMGIKGGQPIWIQPIDEMDVSTSESLLKTAEQRAFAVECVKRHPNWRISAQMHKYLGVR